MTSFFDVSRVESGCARVIEPVRMLLINAGFFLYRAVDGQPHGQAHAVFAEIAGGLRQVRPIIITNQVVPAGILPQDIRRPCSELRPRRGKSPPAGNPNSPECLRHKWVCLPGRRRSSTA